MQLFGINPEIGGLAALKKSNLIKRFLVALIAIPVILYIFYLGGIAFSILIATVSLLAYYEFLSSALNYKSKFFLGGILFFMLIFHVLFFNFHASAFFENHSWAFKFSVEGFLLSVFLLIFLITLIAPIFYFHKERIKFLIKDISIIFFGFFYTQILMASLVILRNLENGLYLILFIFIMVWANDTLAFFGGSLFGKHKLATTISPKKTIEGFLTSFVLTPVFAVIFQLIFKYPGNILKAVILGAVVSFFAMYGDLIESALKRSLDIKDFGKMLPGHGGFLERLDSIIIVSPIVLLFISIFNY